MVCGEELRFALGDVAPPRELHAGHAGVARKRAGESAERMRGGLHWQVFGSARKAARPQRFAERLALRSDLYRYDG